MTVTKRKLQELEVVTYIARQAMDLGKQWTTDQEKLASTIAEILARMVNYENEEQVVKHIDAMLETAEEIGLPEVKSWTYMALVTNWLSWAWHEQGEEELAKAWSDAWYRINDYSLDNLKGEKLKYYVKETD